MFETSAPDHSKRKSRESRAVKPAGQALRREGVKVDIVVYTGAGPNFARFLDNRSALGLSLTGSLFSVDCITAGTASHSSRRMFSDGV
jgi:hypothetical protein